MVEYDGYDINEYYFEYPVNAAGYLTMCVYISKNCINCPHCRYCIRTAGRALDIKRKITFIHRFSLAATRLKHNKKPSQAATRNGSRDTYKQGLISNQNALRLYHKPSIL